MKIPAYPILVLSSVFLLVFSFTAYAQETGLDDVAKELAQDQNNPILLMQQKMLSHQQGIATAPVSNWRRAQRQTNLRRESTGGLRAGRRRGGFAPSAELLTGQRAIDESLQLGSIGMNRTSGIPTDFVSIDDIESVEIPSHPWDKMTEGEAIDVPAIARLVPNDVFFVHMLEPEKFLELEEILKQQAATFGDVYHFGNAARMKDEMARRLGIPDSRALIAAVDEMAFVSDDLAFKPRTDYALVLKLVSTLAEKALELIIGDEAIHRRVGDYLVIATHERMIERIESAHDNASVSMANALDYHYALLKMEPQRDGLIYLSEDFIRKLTGPTYRVNARRRNTILDALETLQYSVFAYRRISGRWPVSLQEMAAENYIADDAIYAPTNYSIDKNGRVSHNVWGSLWHTTPVSRVPLAQIAVSEKSDYERFSAGYKNFFREFFDPIGVAYTISDQLYLHTLILPLIENSEYRSLQAFFRGEPSVLSFLFDPDRLGAANFAATFSIDDLLAQTWRNRPPPDGVDETPQARRERLIYDAENELSNELFDQALVPGERLLDFIGDEIMLGVGEKNSFTMSNIADIDVWLGLKLNDRVRAEAFFRRLWLRFAAEFGGRGGGLFQLSSTEPLSNEYNGQQYFLLPTGFVNVFYVFFDDAFYLTVSQVSMNRLIDARNNAAKDEFSERLQRGFAHIGNTHNIVAALDLEKVATFDLGQELSFWGARVATQFEAHRSTLNEALTLAKLLPDYDGTLSNLTAYYGDLPHDFYGAQLVVDDGVLYLSANQQRTPVRDIPSNRRGIELSELLKATLSPDDLRARLREFRAASLGLSFIPDGLEVKLSIGNPNVSAADARFAHAKSTTDPRTTTNYRRTAAIMAALIIALSVIGIIARRRKSS